MAPVIDQPSYAISVQEDSEGNPWMGLVIQTSSMSFTVFLADRTSFREVAAKLHDGIMKAGREMNKPKIFVADGALPGKLNGHITKGRG